MKTVIEGIHAGMTKNFNYYSRGELERVVGTWLEPYLKPVLTHHNTHSEPLGRVIDAKVKRSRLKKGSYCTELTLKILDSDAQEKVRDGRYSTVSIGSTVTSAICSICGNDWAKNYCEHRKGRVYDGNKLCYWKLTLSEHSEVSFVNVPADEYAQVIAIYDDDDDGGKEERRVSTKMGKNEYVLDTEDIMDAYADEAKTDSNDVQDQPNPSDFADKSTESQADDVQTDESAAKLQTKVEGLIADLQEGFESEITKLKEELQKVDEKCTALLENNDVLVQQNTELAQLVYVELTEHYCDVAVLAGLYESKEAASKAIAEKKPIELRREIAQIMMQPRTRTVNHVNYPGGEGVIKREKMTTTDDKDDNKKYTLKDLEDAISNFMTRRNQ